MSVDTDATKPAILRRAESALRTAALAYARVLWDGVDPEVIDQLEGCLRQAATEYDNVRRACIDTRPIRRTT